MQPSRAPASTAKDYSFTPMAVWSLERAEALHMQALWDLRDYRGRYAQTGIYLIIVITTDGIESVAGKLAVVR